ncbi:hypothetical protein FOA43_000451 [Brettanomyces nanus]|uniref:Chloride channel protein n=1 Tax=Eeniella nana TaxID=13502 RepID=A0A875RYL2_EENNA|nr:uncharacterized protein FOA43_000451 [Brettanomyces nanus]QPG73145.1 hypothetical protein FOA43_000451 [Brettanomyces nanus]
MSPRYTSARQIKDDPRFSLIPVISYSSHSTTISSATLNDSDDITPPSGSPKYEENTFIDWQYEYARLNFPKRIWSQSASRFKRFENLSVRWLTLIISSIGTAMVTLLIDYVGMLFHDIKFGICLDSFYRVRSKCYTKWSNWGPLFVSETLLQTIINFAVVLITTTLLAIGAFKIAARHSDISKSGIAEMKMIVSGLFLPRFLNSSLIFSKIISLLMVIASGLWLGYEGPLVHIACALLSTCLDVFSRFGVGFTNEAIRREFLSSGFSIGIASAFNAPIGGVLFGLEQIQSYFPVDKMMWNSFICTTIGVTVLQKLNPFKDVSVNDSFKVDFKNNWLYFEAFVYIFLGLICGSLGILFNKLNTTFARFRKRHIGGSSGLRLTEVVVVAIVSNVLAFCFNASHRSITEMMDLLFTDCADDPNSPLCSLDNTEGFPIKTLLVLLFLIVQGYFLSAYTYGIFVPGGALIPALTVGALIGRFVGVLVEFIQYRFSDLSVFLHCYNEKISCISVASYAVVGSASFFAAVTKMSVASVVIVFELTGALNYIIPIMMGVFCAKVLNDLFLGKSIYELWLIAENECYLPSNLEDTMTVSEMSMMSATQLMTSADDLEVIYDSRCITVQDLEDVPASLYGHPILKSPSDPELIGYVTSFQIGQEVDRIHTNLTPTTDTNESVRNEAEDGNSNGYFSLGQTMTPLADLFVVAPNFNLLTAYQAMDKLKLSNIFVCHAGTSNFRGVISKQDLVQFVHLNDKKLKKEVGI